MNRFRLGLRATLLAVAFVAAPAVGLVSARGQSTPAPAEAAALARAFYEPFNTGDVSVYDRVLAPDWADHPLAPGQAPGRDGADGVIAAFRAAFPDLRVVTEDLLVSGDRVTVRSTFGGTHRGAIFGIPPTGRPVEAMAIDIHRIEGGRIVESWHVEDWLTVFGQLGVGFLPPTEAATPTA
jgi:predicted ester cyclase